MPSAEAATSRNSLAVVRLNEVSNGKRRGSRSCRTSMRSSFMSGRRGGRRLTPRGGGALGRAAPAEAEDVVPVPVDHEVDTGRDLLLDALDLWARELEDVAARLADEVIVMGALVLELEAGLPVEGQLAREAGGGQELQGAVDGGAADVGAPLLDDAQEVVHREVALRLQEDVEDDLALLAALETVLHQVRGEDLLFLTAQRGCLCRP